MPLLPLEKKIISAFKAVNTEALKDDLSDGGWTKLLKVKLCELGEDDGYIACTSGHGERFFGEWLYDLIWYADDAEGRIIELKLILESEWQAGFDHIWYDFEKLLVAKCEHKLMVFQCNQKNREKFVGKMIEAIDAFYPSVPNERYLFICWNKDSMEFEFDLKVSR